MGNLREWLNRLGAAIGLRRRDDDLAEEIRLHTELAAEAGRRASGSTQAMDALRDQRGLPWLEDLARDVRYGLRVLRRSPVFTIVAVLSLALGIGANAAIFHLIDNVRLRSLPVANPRELAEIRLDGPDAFGGYDSVYARATYPLWEQIRSHQAAFSGVFAWGSTQFIVGRGSDARPARGLWVSGELFPVLGLAPERGRLLSPADDRPGCGAQAAVISHGFWQSHFGGAESVIGQTITVLEQPFTIAGVAPRAFTGLEVGQTFDVALPLCSAELFGYKLDQRDRWWLTVMGRLKPGWALARAGDHMRALSPGLLEATVPLDYEKELTDGYRALHFGVIDAGRGVSRLRDAYGASLLLLLGLTGLVLLITCGNLATLMLARASARHREIAVRAAIGASRTRLVSQMVCESLLVAIGGAVLAVPVAVLAGKVLVTFLGTAANPVSLNLAADWRLIAFVAATAILAAVAFGVIPAWRVSVVDPMSALVARGGSIDRYRARFQRGLVAVQVAVSLVLMVSALMFVQTFRNLATVDTGFELEGTVAIWFFDPAARDLSVEQKIAFQEQLTSAIRAVPGVAAAATSSHVPLSGGTWSHFFRVAGAAQEERKAARFAYVDAAYFDTLKIPVRTGRSFTALDTARSRRVMIVNESFVRSHLGGMNPIGARIRTAAEAEFPETTYEIVGVAGDTKYGDLRDEDCWCEAGSVTMPPIAYVPFAQIARPYAWSPVMARVAPGASGVTPAIATAVARLNPGIAVDVNDLRSFIDQRLTGERITAWLAGAFGVLATVLVIVGLYGLIAYLAVGRRSEIGVRLSLGSTRAQIVRLMLRDSLWMLAIGVLIGLPVAARVTRTAAALLFGVSATDVPTLAGATLLLAAAAGLAASIPALRASRLDPNVVLRAE
jgi:putative ABC transport system permease protein